MKGEFFVLYYLDDSVRTNIKAVKLLTLDDIGWTEKDLENLISENITKLIPENQLMVLFQEKPFLEAADIYALDKEGNLYIFELKRWKSNQENILQVLRYGQIYGQYSYEQLQDMLRNYKKMPDLDLAEKHFEYFREVMEDKLSPNNFNRKQKFIVVTNGNDLQTLNAIKYWQDKGLDIESIIYKVYKIGNEILLDFNPYNPEREVIIEEEEGCFIVNTNITWSKTNYREMLNEEKASAYYDRKNGITRIKKGDEVFLYHTGVGIIAFGKAIDNWKSKDIYGDKNEEYYIKLRFDWKIDPDVEADRAVKAWEINNELKSGHRFRQTVFSISKEMAEVIKKLCRLK
jgi:predicted RNA-binding protein with PUA-like domain